MDTRLPARRKVRARNALVLKWLKLVPWAIYAQSKDTAYGRHLRRMAHVVGHEDMMQVGRLALLRAAELWNPRKGKFSTYATICVQKSVFRAFRKQRTGLNTVLLEDTDTSSCLTYDPEVKDFTDLIVKALRTLPERYRRVLELRFFELKGGKPLTLKEVGKVLEVTQERVRQMEMKAIRKLAISYKLARGAGLHKCGLCSRWAEWDLTCPHCKKLGCPVCVEKRESGQACQSCQRDMRLEAVRKEEGYATPFPYFPRGQHLKGRQ